MLFRHRVGPGRHEVGRTAGAGVLCRLVDDAALRSPHQGASAFIGLADAQVAEGDVELPDCAEVGLQHTPSIVSTVDRDLERPVGVYGGEWLHHHPEMFGAYLGKRLSLVGCERDAVLAVFRNGEAACGNVTNFKGQLVRANLVWARVRAAGGMLPARQLPAVLAHQVAARQQHCSLYIGATAIPAFREAVYGKLLDLADWSTRPSLGAEQLLSW